MLARPGFVINECFLQTQHKLVQVVKLQCV